MASVMTTAAAAQKRTARGTVHCLICTRNVEADVVVVGRKVFVQAGQKCPRCASTLDPAYVLDVQQAA